MALRVAVTDAVVDGVRVGVTVTEDEAVLVEVDVLLAVTDDVGVTEGVIEIEGVIDIVGVVDGVIDGLGEELTEDVALELTEMDGVGLGLALTEGSTTDVIG